MISIRPYQPGDAPAFHAAAIESVAELQPWMPWCHPGFSLADAEAWVARQVVSFATRSEFEFLIVDALGVLIGACGVNTIDSINRRANVGYWMRTSAARRGYATVALRQLVGWTYANTDLNRLEVVVATGNVASLRVAEKAGAIAEAILRGRLLLHDRYHDAMMFSFVRGDW